MTTITLWWTVYKQLRRTKEKNQPRGNHLVGFQMQTTHNLDLVQHLQVPEKGIKYEKRYEMRKKVNKWKNRYQAS